MKKLAFLSVLFINFFAVAQITAIPDPNFEQALIDLGYDNVLDGSVLTANINTLTSLSVSSKNISDLTGIEDFVALTFLACSYNSLSSLNVTQNTGLLLLSCASNQLTSLDISNNTALTELYCRENSLTSLDVANNTALTKLYCEDNHLTNLDVTNNTALLIFYCKKNQLTSLDISNNTVLKSLNFGYNSITNIDLLSNTALEGLVSSNNPLTNLDVSANIVLSYLNCDYNQLTDLDVTQNTNLKNLYCRNNQLSKLDLSQNTALESLGCYNNDLTILNLKNGNNSNITSIESTNNPNLSCIEVDDAAWSTANWLNVVDPQSSFSENCHYDDTYVPDDNFEQALIDLGYDTVLDDYVTTATINTITNLDVSNKNISDLTGIENFIALTTLKCYSNSLTSLDVSNSTNLSTLWFLNNLIESIDLSNNLLLTDLRCRNNLLTTLDLSTNTALTFLRCSSSSQLVSLNVKNGNNTNFTFFDVTNNPNLLCIEVDDVTWSTANWLNIDPQSSFSEIDCFLVLSDFFTYVPDDNFEQALIDLGYDTGALDDYVLTSNIITTTSLTIDSKNIVDLTGIEDFIALTDLRCSNNNLTSLDISQNTNLTQLYCDDNQLTILDVSQNTNLTQLSCYSNQLTSLNVSQNTNLTMLNCYSNQLSSLDLAQNTALSYLECSYNQLSSLDVTQNTALFYLSCDSNQLTNINVTQNSILYSLYCYDNNITSLDVTQNTALANLSCAYNQLTSLNVKNGNNINFSYFEAYNNPNLICIEVDDAVWSTTNWVDIDATASFSEYCNTCIVNIPDANFKFFLINDTTINTNGDSEIQCDEASAFTGSIQASYWSISDLTGIEAFTSLTELYCNNNDLTSLDISQNTALTILNTNANPMNTIDVTSNTALIVLHCSSNLLSTLDVSQNLFLIELYSNNNTLGTLNLSQNQDLEILRCYNNQLTNLDLNQNTFLFELDCDNNLLTSLDLSLNTDLGSLVCSNNSLSTLDLSQNTFLDFLICTYNAPLTSLNVANGNNINFSYFRADNNLNLTCIEVDDAIWSTSNWTNIDPQTSFSEDCSISNCTNTATYTSSGWTPNAPTNNTSTIIAFNYDTTLQGANIDACELTIDSGITLTIGASDYLKIEKNITVNGSLIVQNEGSLVQTDDTALVINNGTILVEKITPALTDRGFSILGSPMSGETKEGVYTNTVLVRHHLTSNFTPHPQVAIDFPLAENFADDNGDNWQTHNGALTVGEGYLVKPFVIGSAGGTYTTNYTQGTLNNGIINFTTIFGDNQNDSPNILSNPYASAVDAFAFITDNSIVDAIYYWEHITIPNGSYPGYNSSNYDMGDISMYNLSGGITAANAGGTAQASNQFIPSGQGFGIKANAAGTIIFNNSMRVTSPNDGYRTIEIAIDRLHLNLKNNTYGLKSGTLIAFTEGATNGYDSNYDSKRLATPVSIYSINSDRELGIQGRSAFTENQIIPLGFSTQVEGIQEYTISISSIEGGLISLATVFLKDKLLNTLTNLSEIDYTFNANESQQNDRFVIVFVEDILETDDLNAESISIYPNPTQNILNIVSPQFEITSVSVYDVRGRLINNVAINYQKIYQLNMSILESAMYFVTINTEFGSITKSIVKE